MNRFALLYFGFAAVVLWSATATAAETPNEQADSDTNGT